MSEPVTRDPEWPLWRTGGAHGLRLAEAGPRIWISEDLLRDLLECMPLFPVALVSTDFSRCPEGHYEPGEGSVGAILRFKMDDGRRLVYRIVRFDLMRQAYEARWPD
jgi:hypothetical protein